MLPLFLSAQAERLFNEIELGAPLELVAEKLGEIAESSDIIFIDNPSFPLAKDKETHLVCSRIKTESGVIQNAVFTFADDQLTFIMAKGNAIKPFTSKHSDTASTYLDYSIYSKDNLFLDKKKDIAWIVNDEAIHVNLFTWENPLLDPSYSREKPQSPFPLIPAFLKMGASMEVIKPLMETNSKFISVEELDGDDPNAQVQINGFGVHCLGFPRKIEARFGDNKLNVVWILTGKGEEERIRKALIDQFGGPIYTNNEWEIYNNWQVGLRKDKPEVLLMEKQIGLAYKSSYFKQ
jgi:hypothetical protein